MSRIKANQKRAQAIIETFRGNSDEFAMLKGILCASHGLDYKASLELRKVICSNTIARRMDEMRREAIASLERSAS